MIAVLSHFGTHQLESHWPVFLQVEGHMVAVTVVVVGKCIPFFLLESFLVLVIAVHYEHSSEGFEGTSSKFE